MNNDEPYYKAYEREKVHILELLRYLDTDQTARALTKLFLIDNLIYKETQRRDIHQKFLSKDIVIPIEKREVKHFFIRRGIIPHE